jgi:hypothetical protein
LLKVEIVKVRPNTGLATSQVYSDVGGLATDTRVRLLNNPIPARRYLWRLDTTRMVGVTEMPKSRVKRMEIDLQPMLGRVAVAPRGAGGLRRTLARGLRRQHGRARSARGHHRLPPDLSRRRLL